MTKYSPHGRKMMDRYQKKVERREMRVGNPKKNKTTTLEHKLRQAAHRLSKITSERTLYEHELQQREKVNTELRRLGLEKDIRIHELERQAYIMKTTVDSVQEENRFMRDGLIPQPKIRRIKVRHE